MGMSIAVGGTAGVVVAGLSIRCIVAPEGISYSLTSFVSVKAFPLRSNLWVSTAGAEDDDLAISDFRSVMVSVMESVSGMVRAGLSDLTVMEMVVSVGR